jgi:succinate dehydrogenase / fumarate reductase membrane anchor subunit
MADNRADTRVSMRTPLASIAGRTYEEAVAIVSHPLIAILLILAVISVTNHMRLGMQIIIEDYVHDKGLKIAALIANNFYAVVIAVACLYGLIKVGLGRVL